MTSKQTRPAANNQAVAAMRSQQLKLCLTTAVMVGVHSRRLHRPDCQMAVRQRQQHLQ
jgi:hypothetical protein